MARFPQSFLDDIRDRVPISTIVGQHVQWDRRKTSTTRGDYWACCPFHGEKSPSFHCEDKKGRYHCFGCGVSGDHFRFLTEFNRMSFPDAVADIASLAGVPMPARDMTEEDRQRLAARDEERRQRDAEAARRAEAEKLARTMSAADIWKQTEPLVGTFGYIYFEWRCPGLAPPAEETEVRFHPKLELNPDKPTGDRWPCIVSRVSDQQGRGIAIWRIYIARNGQGKMPVADGFSAKLGYGPAAGGAVRLGGLGKTIGICEGVETARAVRLLGVTYPVWPTLSTAGIIGFKIPREVETVICYPDPDGSKLKTRTRHDGTKFIAQPPGLEAVRKFREANPGWDIRMADHANDHDYLEIAQRVKGVPVR